MSKFIVPTKAVLAKEQKENRVSDFEAIYCRYVTKVYQKCFSLTKDADIAQDFTQDIFIKVYYKLHTFENRSSLTTWLYSIAHNYCLDQLRFSRRVRVETLSDAVINQAEDSHESEYMAQKWGILETSMQELSASEKAVLRLKHEEGLSIKAISEELKLSESAVKMRLKRTRDKLQSLCVSTL